MSGAELEFCHFEMPQDPRERIGFVLAELRGCVRRLNYILEQIDPLPQAEPTALDDLVYHAENFLVCMYDLLSRLQGERSPSSGAAVPNEDSVEAGGRHT